MKFLSLFFLGIVLAAAGNVAAQTTSPNRTNLSYPFELNPHELGTIVDYSIRARVVGNQAFEYTIQMDDDPDMKETFLVRPNNLSSFVAKAREKFSALLVKGKVPKASELKKVVQPDSGQHKRDTTSTEKDSTATEKDSTITSAPRKTYEELMAEFDKINLESIFLFFQGAEIMIGSFDYRPKAGEIFFGNDVVVSKWTKKWDKVITDTVNRYDIMNVEIEFDEGYIENVKVDVAYGNIVLKFENAYPIGFASKRDYRIIEGVSLYATEDKDRYYMGLRDVITRYEQKHEVGRRDYSPANQVITLDFKTDPRRQIELSKESTSKLFELKTFSDFVGFDKDKPNGLIQFEVDKRLNLNSRRNGRFKKSQYSYGAFQFLLPSIVVSKIEDNNKFLILNYKDQFTNNAYDPIKFTSTLELKRFENFSVGADINWFIIDVPPMKSSLCVNGGFRYGRVSVRDSLRVFSNNAVETTDFVNEYGVNTYTVTPFKAVWEVRTDERYTFSLGGGLNFYFLRDNSFSQVANIPTFAETPDDGGDSKILYKHVLMQLSLKPQTEGTGKLFFRYQYNWQHGFWRTGFHQIQVGYSVPLMKQLKTNQN
ncbi:hypothetical protein KK062_09410 [Fulvivirgaceae bacterium PWU5]|uniref:Uncharacterized protein n=1 Tax=Dawidia cretensis TaxID=2782350 RepID=A0AAP2DWA5_9BACT|nr:hypothetical protein [Dawidia cretensis]MBT1708441.1 hypothetical protein [Dawidia cretensis]